MVWGLNPVRLKECWGKRGALEMKRNRKDIGRWGLGKKGGSIL